MENEHLADEYVQDFVPDHLDDVTVNREDKRQIMEAETWLHQEDSSSRMCMSQWDDRRIPSPPPDIIYAPQPVLANIIEKSMVNMSLINDPGTPSMDLKPSHCMGGQPDSERMDYIPSGITPENSDHGMHQRPQSEVSVVSPRLNNHNSGACSEEVLNDELLMSLSVRELNKRLEGFTPKEVWRIKYRRRLLRSRGYEYQKFKAQQQYLKRNNRILQDKMHSTKVEEVYQ